ncbi:hypothetical protein SLEP1_g55831 [Rubroshorea leprosula]|uniref:Uncharacterized protein n=1 Tax=Rubroshorea leprosula TaxID=152421 RepID=A0AAV5MGI7_9ROSI|nr:hypothetical protein SLEP1_g55831 [Rubroshorea leprosula]
MQYSCDHPFLITNLGLPCSSIPQEKSPGDGSLEFFHAMRRHSRPVHKSHPMLIPGGNDKIVRIQELQYWISSFSCQVDRPNSSDILSQKLKLTCFLNCQHSERVIYWIQPVCNPNNCPGWDFLVPDYQVPVPGTAWTEETQFRASINETKVLPSGRDSDGEMKSSEAEAEFKKMRKQVLINAIKLKTWIDVQN